MIADAASIAFDTLASVPLVLTGAFPAARVTSVFSPSMYTESVYIALTAVSWIVLVVFAFLWVTLLTAFLVAVLTEVFSTALETFGCSFAVYAKVLRTIGTGTAGSPVIADAASCAFVTNASVFPVHTGGFPAARVTPVFSPFVRYTESLRIALDAVSWIGPVVWAERLSFGERVSFGTNRQICKAR